MKEKKGTRERKLREGRSLGQLPCRTRGKRKIVLGVGNKNNTVWGKTRRFEETRKEKGYGGVKKEYERRGRQPIHWLRKNEEEQPCVLWGC